MFPSSSYTPNSTPSSNSSTNATPKIRFNQVVKDSSPLYSKEQQIIIKRTKAELEMNIASLTKRKQILINQLNQIKANFVSYGELIQLKSSIEFNFTTEKSQEISSLMSEYIETVQGNYELEAECEIIAKRIKKETTNRQNELELSKQISDAFDFSSMSISLPEISKNIDIAKDNVIKSEINLLQRKLDDTKKEKMSNDIKTPSSAIVYEAIGSYSKKSETEWQIRSIGSNILRSQIRNLQKQIVDGTSFVNKIQEMITKEKEKLTFIKTQAFEAIANAKSNNDSSKLRFEDQINQMDQSINQLKKDIEKSVFNYNFITEEINTLAEKSILINEELNDQNDENEDDDFYDTKDNNATLKIKSLSDQKVLLEKEINDLKKKYQKEKAAIQMRESTLKKRVIKLSKQYANNKKLISKYAQKLSTNTGNPIDKEMFQLINHIDSTIDELRSTYA